MVSFIAYVGSVVFLLISLLFLLTSFVKAKEISGEVIIRCWVFCIVFMSLAGLCAYLGGI